MVSPSFAPLSEEAPYLIVIFAQNHGVTGDGTRLSAQDHQEVGEIVTFR